MQKTDSLFFTNIIDIDEKIESVVAELISFSERSSQQVYVIKKPLGSSINFNYDIDDIVLILIPKHPILVLSYGNYSENELEEYKEDLKDDLGLLSSKYEYNKILGRPRKWDNNLIKVDKIDNFCVSKFLEEKVEKEQIRRIDLLISLLIGSINNIDKIGIDEPKTTLDQIKQKIVLFDGRQSEFIYLPTNKKDITIQGMAGTGKTELLLYKLKEIFINDKDSTIAFTCYNKVLASEMKKRVPAFFNAMKIEEQIQWNEKMYVFPSWGSANDKVSGMYRYICSFYDLTFYTYSQNHDFDDLCKKVLEALNSINNFETCFDYVFIDESQDFGNYFFEMCKKVTKNKVFIAGDIFQNIFDNNFDESITPDYLLNNCYRTDPRTLMIAHSIGLGLCEHPPISWLNDSGWKACGYQINRTSSDSREFNLTRRPLRRFEDIQTKSTFELIPYEHDNVVNDVLHTITEIQDNNPTVKPDDIAVIIVSEFNTVCSIADKIEFKIRSEKGWNCAKGYETKEKKSDKLFISNVNNIKGLEFPFIICVTTGHIGKGTIYRNSIYMVLTRSFLTSYFLVEDFNTDFINSYRLAMQCINEKECLQLIEPTEEEKREIKRTITINSNKNAQVSEIIKEVLDEYKNQLSPEQEKNLKDLFATFSGEPLETVRSKMINIIKSVI